MKQLFFDVQNHVQSKFGSENLNFFYFHDLYMKYVDPYQKQINHEIVIDTLIEFKTFQDCYLEKAIELWSYKSPEINKCKIIENIKIYCDYNHFQILKDFMSLYGVHCICFNDNVGAIVGLMVLENHYHHWSVYSL